MIRTNSKALLQYLLEQGVLEGTEAEINKARKEYRRLYRKNWRQTAKRCKELRPTFTNKEFDELCLRSKLYGMAPTTYARETILAVQEKGELIPDIGTLRHISAALGMALRAFQNNNGSIEPQALLERADTMLNEYLNNSK